MEVKYSFRQVSQLFSNQERISVNICLSSWKCSFPCCNPWNQFLKYLLRVGGEGSSMQIPVLIDKITYTSE